MLFNREKTGKGHLAWGIFYGIALTGFTVYTLLDSFVLPKNVVALENNNTERQTIEETGTIEGKQAVVTKNSYESEDISINITTKYEYDTKIYIADVTVSDVSFLRAGLANGVFGRNIKETTSDIAKENNAIFAINGDFYGFRDSGPVIRNGVMEENRRFSITPRMRFWRNTKFRRKHCIVDVSYTTSLRLKKVIVYSTTASL